MKSQQNITELVTRPGIALTCQLCRMASGCHMEGTIGRVEASGSAGLSIRCQRRWLRDKPSRLRGWTKPGMRAITQTCISKISCIFSTLKHPAQVLRWKLFSKILSCSEEANFCTAKKKIAHTSAVQQVAVGLGLATPRSFGCRTLQRKRPQDPFLRTLTTPELWPAKINHIRP